VGFSLTKLTVLAAIFAYFVMQALNFSLFKTGADIDTAELLLYIQSFEMGYGGSQPPFFNWVALLATEAFGVNLVVLAFAKFLFLALACAFLFLSAQMLGLSVLASLVALTGVFLMPELGWETQRALTHSIPMLAFCAIGFYCFVTASKTNSWTAYLGFGLAMALSVLSKYNGILFFAALLVTGVSLRQFREVVVSWRMLAALALAALCILPHGLWALENLGKVMQRADKFAIDPTVSLWSARGQGLTSFLEAIVSVIGPILLIVLGVMAIQKLRRANRGPRNLRRLENLPLRTVGVGLGLVVLMVLVSGSANVLNRWLSPALLLFPMGAAIWLDQSGNRGALKTLVVMGTATAVVYAIVLPLSITRATDDAARRSMLDYEGFWQQALSEDGPICSVLTTEYAVFGNLRLVAPDIQVAHTVFHTDIPKDEACGLMLAWRGATNTLPEPFLSTLHANGIVGDLGPIKQLSVARIDDPDDTTYLNYMIMQR